MEPSEWTTEFVKFFEKVYEEELLKSIAEGKPLIEVDFAELSKFNPELAEDLIEKPEEVIEAAEFATKQIEGNKGIKVRLVNVSGSQKILIRNVRSNHLSKLLVIEGTVRQKSDVRPQVTEAKFECPSCGNILNVLQLDEKFKEPSKCGCGRKGKFRLLQKQFVDAQSLVLEEASEDLDGGEQPKRMRVLLKNDLVSPLSEKKTNPGSKVTIVGVLGEVPITLRSGGQSVRFDIILDANNTEANTEEFSNIEISKEDEAQIKEFAQDPKLYETLGKGIAPSIYGHELIKDALVLQLMGGVRKKRSDGVVTRGDMHVLLIGDPGSGKSMMLKRINVVAPKARFVSGKGVSGAGLTASVVKDEFMSGWSLEAGAMVLANKGIICIDELDKMSNEDRAAMHEALEGQTITISKANVQATLRCETTVLAAANPKFGRFDPYGTIAEQIDLPPTLINRFDLIFPVKDLPDETHDARLAKFVLDLHKDTEEKEEVLPTKFIRKYIAYAKQNIFPKLSTAAIDEIKGYYLQMRSSGGKDSKSVPISARQLEGLIRMSEAVARTRLSQKVERKDAQKAIALMDHCLRQIAFDEETGQIDIDRIATSVPAAQRNKIMTVKEIIHELEKTIGKAIPIEEIMKAADAKDMKEADVEEAIEKLKRSGDLFEPRKGFLSRI